MAYEYTRENNLYYDVAYLIEKERYVDADGVEHVNENEREVFCRVGGIYSKEFNEAYQAGIQLAYKLVIPTIDYNDETTVKYNDKKYAVYRTFPSGDTIELYVQQDAGEWKQ